MSHFVLEAVQKTPSIHDEKETNMHETDEPNREDFRDSFVPQTEGKNIEIYSAKFSFTWPFFADEASTQTQQALDIFSKFEEEKEPEEELQELYPEIPKVSKHVKRLPLRIVAQVNLDSSPETEPSVSKQ